MLLLRVYFSYGTMSRRVAVDQSAGVGSMRTARLAAQQIPCLPGNVTQAAVSARIRRPSCRPGPHRYNPLIQLNHTFIISVKSLPFVLLAWKVL